MNIPDILLQPDIVTDSASITGLPHKPISPFHASPLSCWNEDTRSGKHLISQFPAIQAQSVLHSSQNIRDGERRIRSS